MQPVTFVLSRFVRDLPRRLLLTAVRAYRLFVSPALGASCRFEPSCSAYAIGALETHGAAVGACLTLRRIARCGPWCAGGHDPVPRRAESASSSPSSTASPHP